MAPESTALSSDPAAAGKTEPPAASDRAPRRSERRLPTAREKAITLPDIEEEAYSFEPHDTIPAPPLWHDDEIAPTTKPSQRP
jgi:hypothetical protein